MKKYIKVREFDPIRIGIINNNLEKEKIFGLEGSENPPEGTEVEILGVVLDSSNNPTQEYRVRLEDESGYILQDEFNFKEI